MSRWRDATRRSHGARPSVSVVIPAHDSAATIEVPLRSLFGQTCADWDAIVVDDGSSDGTADTVRAIASGDPRVRVVSQPASGVSAARNRGLAEATHEFVLFLDADDYIEPDTFERVVGVLAANPHLDGVRYDWVLESDSGRRARVSSGALDAEATNLFEIASEHCPFAIHACVVRRSRIQDVGGFDPTLVAGEDWDLWQRVGRTDARIGQVREALAHYVLRSESAMRKNFGRVLADCLRVIDRIGQPDDRVPAALARSEHSVPPASLAVTRRREFLKTLALACGAGADVQQVLDTFPNPGRGSLDVDMAANVMHDLVPNGACLVAADWPTAWPALAERVRATLDGLAAWDGDPALAERIMRRLEVKVLRTSSGALDRAGETRCVTIDLADPIPSYEIGDASRLVGVVRYGERRLGCIEVPVVDGSVTPGVVRQAIVEQLGPSVVRRVASHPDAARRLVAGSARALTRASLWRSVFETRASTVPAARRELRGLSFTVARESLERSSVIRASDVGVVPASGGGHWRSPQAPRGGAAAGVTRRLPILMYHRVADEGPAPLDRYRISPAGFAEQLELLRREGYRGATLEEWADAIRSGRPLPGARVALTFDDGYCDFAEFALPVLEEFGFSATVFVVTGRVGETSAWDGDLGESAPLMDWDELSYISARGIDIGSHTRLHRHLTSLSPDEAVANERLARAALAERLGVVDPSVSYPYGDIDPAQRIAMELAGYRVGVTTRHGVSSRFNHPMELARLEIKGDLALADFGQLVGVGSGRR